MSLSRNVVERGAARVKVGEAGENVIELEGVMRETHDGEWFATLIADWHREAVATEVTELVLDLRRLEYANSAVFKCLAGWIRLLHDDRASVYAIRVRWDPAQHWQRLGLKALNALEPHRFVL